LSRARLGDSGHVSRGLRTSLGFVGRAVEVGHPHAAKADPRDPETRRAQRARVHRHPPSCDKLDRLSFDIQTSNSRATWRRNSPSIAQTSPSEVRADVIRKLLERPDYQEMADLLIFLEEWEWARQGMIEELSRRSSSQSITSSSKVLRHWNAGARFRVSHRLTYGGCRM
jgi:hypothetical protein